MAMTRTRHRNIVKAIRRGLLLAHHQAASIVDHNWIGLATMADRPLHGLRVVAVQTGGNYRGDWSGTAELYDGDAHLGFIAVPAGLMKPVLTASIARAYGLPDEDVRAYEAMLGSDSSALDEILGMDDADAEAFEEALRIESDDIDHLLKVERDAFRLAA